MLQRTNKVPRQLHAAIEHHRAGRLEAAKAIYKKFPKVPDALYLLGVLFHESGKPDESVRMLKQAIAKNPRQALYYRCLGFAYCDLGQYEWAVESYRKSILLGAEEELSYRVLGNALLRLGRFEEAHQAYERGLLLDPAAAFSRLGLMAALCDLGQYQKSIQYGLQLVREHPELPEVYYCLGVTLQRDDKTGEARKCIEKYLSLSPREAKGWHLLSENRHIDKDLEGIRHCAEKVLECDPGLHFSFSTLLSTAGYLPDLSAEQLFQKHLEFSARYEASLVGGVRPHPNQPDPNRKLRIGYISPEFRRHAMQYFIEPVLRAHDRAAFEVYCYYNWKKDDEVTERFKTLADCWIPCAFMSEDQLAERIRADGIDILVDLSGHTGDHRLLTFARKPAPVQVTWMGYPNTTGLRSMDYRITDALMDPVGVSERYHTEELVRLPYAAGYVPPEGCPEVSGLPALRTGTFTFACLNNPMKLNEPLVAVWARILQAVPGSRLMLGSMDALEVRQRVAGWFAREGVVESRLRMLRTMSMPEYLAVHAEVDLALDPFPYCGGTTTNHSLWMGVPVLTRVGETSVSRIGSVLMTRAGLPEFITRTADEYVERAVAIASDLPTLEAVRLGLRERMRNQAALDPAVFIKYVEQAFRDMWQRWCTSQKGGH